MKNLTNRQKNLYAVKSGNSTEIIEAWNELEASRQYSAKFYNYEIGSPVISSVTLYQDNNINS